jgi:CRISPR system Cascade subunit CasA
LNWSGGIIHPGYQDGVPEPSVSVDYSGTMDGKKGKPRAMWAKPMERPWRSLPALLSFLALDGNKRADCYQLRLTVRRAAKNGISIGIWSGGLKVSSATSKQFISGSDDFVESLIQISSAWLGERSFTLLKSEMNGLEGLSETVKTATRRYFESQKAKNKGKGAAGQASHLFWQLCESPFHELMDACYADSPELINEIRRKFALIAQRAYDARCKKDTSRQLDAWAKNIPNLKNYLHSDSKEPS